MGEVCVSRVTPWSFTEGAGSPDILSRVDVGTPQPEICPSRDTEGRRWVSPAPSLDLAPCHSSNKENILVA